MKSKELIEDIYRISLTDQKTIGQKTLKLAEETGEVAQAVLIYEQAHGTSYRGKTVTKADILDEVADIMLVGYSLAYKMGFGIEEFNVAINKKLDKWKMAIGVKDDE